MTAVICDGETLTWAEFTADIHRFAGALLNAGVQPGDKVAVVMSNGMEMAQALFGCMPAGCASVPINLTISDDAVAAMSPRCGCIDDRRRPGPAAAY
ncbi:MAG: AMP-binding protein [Gammaproteobacteria bacterium]|nr:AMP-binding protein [Gammaproteobacteria bacterium]